jgi:hypothetical protein
MRQDVARAGCTFGVTGLLAGCLWCPGAYALDCAAIEASFTGNSFFADGNDRSVTGPPGSQSPIAGLATRTESNAFEARQSLVLTP